MPQGHSMVANGNIAPCRFVKQDVTATGKVLQAGAGEFVYGISQAAKHNIPLSGGGFSSLDDGYAAVAGEMIHIYGVGESNVYLECGDVVANGDLLKSDVDGKGVPATTDKSKYGARALAVGAVGLLIPVEIIIGEISV